MSQISTLTQYASRGRSTSSFEEEFPEILHIRKEVQSLAARIGSIEVDKEKSKETEKEIAGRVVDLESRVDVHSSTLRTVFDKLNVLEENALLHDPASMSLKLRRCADDARFSVVQGFMVIYPSTFLAKLVINEFDASGRTVEWNTFIKTFQSLLAKHGSHIRSNNQIIIQRDSAFNECNSSALFNIHGVSTSALLDKMASDLPEAAFFKGQIRVGGSAERRSAPVPLDKRLHGEFQVFIPVLIWAFNALKMAIFKEDKKIRNLTESIVRDRAIIADYLGTPLSEEELKEAEEMQTPPPSISSFDIGTGRDLRKDTKWQNFFTYMEKVRLATLDETVAEEREKEGADAIPPSGPFALGTYSGVGTNLSGSNLERLISVTQKDIAKRVQDRNLLKRLRKLRVDKFNVVAKCLGILLNTNFLNLAIYRHSVARLLYNHGAHERIKQHRQFLEGLVHMQHIINKYKEDTVESLNEKANEEIEELDVLQRLNLDTSSLTPATAIEEKLDAAVKDMENMIKKGLLSFDIVNDTKGLHTLLYNSDDYLDEHKLNLENAVDEFLDKTDKSLEGQDGTSDTHLLLAWLNRLRPVE